MKIIIREIMSRDLIIDRNHLSYKKGGYDIVGNYLVYTFLL